MSTTSATQVMPLSHGRVVGIAGVTVATLAVGFAIVDPFLIDDRRRIRHMTRQSALSIQADLAHDVRTRIYAQATVAAGVPAHGRESGPHWERDVLLFLRQFPSYQLMQSVGPNDHIRWTQHRDSAAAERFSFATRPAEVHYALDAAATSGRDVVVSRVFDMPDGRPASAVVVRMGEDPDSASFLIGVIDIRTLISTMLGDHVELGYAIAVLEESRELYRTAHVTSETEEDLAEELPIALSGTTWRVRVWPAPGTIEAHRSALPEIVWMFGGLLGFALVVTLHARRAERKMTQRLSDARDELEQRVRERTGELQSANESLGREILVRRAAEGSLHDLSGRLLHLQDEERRRIAREIHDSTVQALAACAINLDKARLLWRGDPATPQIDSALQDTAASIEAATTEMRTLSHLLHPPVLDELGVGYAIAWYAEGFSARSGIAIRVDVPPGLGRLSRDVELTLFRIVQEALTNIHRHAGSGTARIGVTRESDAICVEIEDHGRGMPPDVLHPTDGRPPRLGVGIAGMRERVRQLGGRIEIANTRTGTLIRTVLPLRPVPPEPFVATEAE